MAKTGGEVLDYSGLAIKASEFQDDNGSVILDTISSTDNAISRFNGTTGVVQDSGVLIDDSNNVTFPDGSVDVDIASHDGTNGLQLGGVLVTASAAEINRIADLSGRVVNLTGTTSITEALHEDKELYVTGTASATYTLPEATGSGAKYDFVIGEVNTNNTVIVVADTTNANFIGSIINLDLDGTAEAGFGCPANCDTITLNGTTTGGQLGDHLHFIDIATDVWSVIGQLQCPSGSNPATCFSAAV
jgi:hypothetical protein